MPQMSVADNPALAAELMREVENGSRSTRPEPPPMRNPSDSVFELCGGYLQNNGMWTRQFEVRELTGRDEEVLGRITDPSRVIIALLERGLVRVGDDEASPAVIDSVLGGDWETITFGSEVEATWTCFSCHKEFQTNINLDEIERRSVTQEDVQFEVTGRKGTTYVVEHPYGATQRKIIAKIDSSGAELNSLLLADCVQQIDGLPLLGMDSVLSLPMADRKRIIKEIDSRRVGPLLGGVKSECPSCGVGQATPVNVAALFR